MTGVYQRDVCPSVPVDEPLTGGWVNFRNPLLPASGRPTSPRTVLDPEPVAVPTPPEPHRPARPRLGPSGELVYRGAGLLGGPASLSPGAARRGRLQPADQSLRASVPTPGKHLRIPACRHLPPASHRRQFLSAGAAYRGHGQKALFRPSLDGLRGQTRSALPRQRSLRRPHRDLQPQPGPNLRSAVSAFHGTPRKALDTPAPNRHGWAHPRRPPPG